MMRKSIGIMTLAAFLFFEYACTQVVKQPIVKLDPAKSRGIKIISVRKKSGEVVKFPEERPGRVVADAVVGDPLEPTGGELVILKSDVKSIKLAETKAGGSQEIQEIETNAGDVYRFKKNANAFTVQEQEDRYIVGVGIRIPFSEIDFVLVKRVDKATTAGTIASVAVIYVVVGIFFLFLALPAAFARALH